MRLQSAISTFTRSITVAEGVFAPGHLGELTRYLPFELVDAVLAETGRVEQRLRALPSRVGVYLVLALGLFPVSLPGVWGKLTAGLAGLPGLALADPSEKALRDLRRRVGVAPLKALFEVVAGPLAQPGTSGVRYRHLRTVAFDGCGSIKVPDSERNRGWLGRIKYRLAWAGYPTVMLMALAETGTRGLLGAVFGPGTGPGSSETAYATRLLPLLDKTMLLLADRAFDGNDFLAAVATRSHFLIRAKSTRRPPVLAVLPDGSFLSLVGGVRVRVIDADVKVTAADGAVHADRYRLITGLLDHRTDPAGQLVRLYAERWEVESAFYSLRHTMLAGHVMRSRDPLGVEQELWAHLVLYQVLRTAMVAAAESRPGTDPDRVSFTLALESAREQALLARGIVDTGQDSDLVGDIGRTVLARLLDKRRPRFSVRKVKSPISRYHARPKGDDRPLTSTDITRIDVLVHVGSSVPPPAAPPDPNTAARADDPAANREQGQDDDAPASAQEPPPGGRRALALALMRTAPDRAWRGRDVARELGITNFNSFCVQMSQWANRGLLHRTAPATYTLTA